MTFTNLGSHSRKLLRLAAMLARSALLAGTAS
jgi:hypothetical protein